jgi:PTH1 family peptidyl-tRNA hydrolase
VIAIVGLGNPGDEYAGTRHNVGFAVVELLADRHRIGLGRTRHRARFGTGRIGGQPVLLAEPLTYMNLSGEAVRPLLAYHGIDPQDGLVVVHDEADLEPGTVRIKQGGGIAGHNGLESLVAHLGRGDFLRVRIGVGRPVGRPEKMADWVLSRPTAAEAPLVEESIVVAADAVEAILRDGPARAMGAVNRRG